MQVIYESVTFGLIVVKTASAVLNERGHSDVRALIVKNGLLYYAIVFSVFVTWATMTIFSPSGLKNAAEAPAIIMTCLMANKLTLSLRAYTSTDEVDDTRNNTLSNIAFRKSSRIKRRRSWIGTSTFEVNEDRDSREVQRSVEPFRVHDVEAFDLPDRRRAEGPESGLDATSTRSVGRDAGE